jgi:integrase/recombinase XerD
MSVTSPFRKRGIGGVEPRPPVPQGTNPVDVLLGRTSPSHLPTARSQLNRMAAFFSANRLDAHGFPWHQLSYAQVADLRARLTAELAPKTCNGYLGTLRAVLRESKRLGLLTADDLDALTDLPPVRGDRLPAGRHVRPDELERLFAYLDGLDTATGARDRAAFAILRGTGIRRAEACALTLDCYDPLHAQLVVNKGKGNRQRVVFLPEWVMAEVERWLWHRGHTPGALFSACDKHGNVWHKRHLHPDTFWERFCAHVQAARVEHFTPHDLRRTFVGDLLEAGHDLVKVQRAAGHSSPAMTARYDRRGLETRRDMAASIPAPGAR